MAAPLSAGRIVAALNKWGVKYREYPGWRTRGRPGTFSNINGFMIHHTGGGSASASYLKFLFETGRPAEGIPGPLCQYAIGADGTVHVGARGRSNHAGRGSSTTLNRVIAESYSGYSSELSPGADNTDGNARFYGVEIIYAGTSAMTSAQYASAVRLSAALMDAHGWTALSVIGHREWSRRKWDPGQCPMDRFRRDVRDLLRGSTPPPPQEDDMPTADEIADAVLDRVLDKVDPNSGSTPRMRVKNMLRHAHYRGNQISVHQLPEMVATQERIESKVEALLGGGHDEVLSRIAANHAETLAALTASAERETAQLELIEEALSGERDASDTLRALRDLIDTAVGDGADPDGEA